MALDDAALIAPGGGTGDPALDELLFGRRPRLIAPGAAPTSSPQGLQVQTLQPGPAAAPAQPARLAPAVTTSGMPGIPNEPARIAPSAMTQSGFPGVPSDSAPARIAPAAASAPDYLQRYKTWETQRPTLDPNAGKPSLLRKILGTAAAGAIGFENPAEGVRVGTSVIDAPRAAAERNFAQQTKDWENQGDQIESEMAVDKAQRAMGGDVARPDERNVLLNGQPAVQRFNAATQQWDTEAGVQPYEKIAPGAEAPKTREVTIGGQPAMQDWDEASKSWRTEQGVSPYVKPAEDRGGSEKPEIIAQIGERPKPGQKNSQGLMEKQWGQRYEQMLNQEAASGAAARGQSYGRNRPVQVIDTWNGNRAVTVSAADAEDNPDRYRTQSGTVPALKQRALINDIRQSAEQVRKNVSVLDSSGLDRATLAASLADPSSTLTAYLQGVPRGALTDDQQQFVADLFNLREQAMAMRAVLGAGQGSDDLRRAVLQTLPGIASDSRLAGKQIDNLEKVLGRLEQGIPNVPLNQPQLPANLPDVKTGGPNGGAIPEGAQWQVDGRVVAVVKGGQWAAP